MKTRNCYARFFCNICNCNFIKDHFACKIFLYMKKFSAPVFSANLWLKAKSACFASVNLKTLAVEGSPPGKNVRQILSDTEAHVRQNRFN